MIIIYLIGLIIKRNVLGRNRSNGGNSNNNGTNPAKPKMVSLSLISNWSSNCCHHVSDDHNCHGDDNPHNSWKHDNIHPQSHDNDNNHPHRHDNDNDH